MAESRFLGTDLHVWVSVHSRKLGAREAGSCGANWAIRVSHFTALPGPSRQRQSGGKPCALS